VELDGIVNRGEAEATLAHYLEDLELRQYLLQNLVREGDSWAWRINLEVLIEEMDAIVDFPTTTAMVYPGPALFIYGSESNYIQKDHHQPIRSLFPYARMRAIAGAGHWVYSDQPRAFQSALDTFLSSLRN
jgi:pimeloyl-ACP methyl ester carboxylesterase